MTLMDMLTFFGERYGLLPIYAVIVAISGFQASTLRQLLMILAIQCGLYVTLFRAFDLGGSLDVFGWAARYNLKPDIANGLAAAAFVFGLGFAVFGLKKLALALTRKPTPLE
jgi:hypothetical protein